MSGSSRDEIDSILDRNTGSSSFAFVISGDDLYPGQGKPDPASFEAALQRMNLEPSKVMLVENSQLGVESAYSAHVPFIVTLNNTSLNVQVNLDLFMRLDEREC